MKEQIEEKHALSESIYMSGHGLDWKDSDDIAEQLYTEGYRKQSEGVWIERIYKPYWLEDDVEVFYSCSLCETSHWGMSPYCPNCGAKMKGGAE